MADLSFGDVFNGALGAWSEYNKTQQEASKADQTQQNYQNSLNQANLTAKLAQNKTIVVGIIGAVVVFIAYLMFKK